MLTWLFGKLASSRQRWIKNTFIAIFCRCYAVDMRAALEKNPFAYATFHDFFIRRLTQDARPLDNALDSIVSPADGTWSVQGRVTAGTLLQAKGKTYSALQLLAGDVALTETFAGGCYALIYLAPHKYHRVHMPITGRLLDMIYVPGALFSVSPFTAQHIDGLFAKNERIIAVFETALGKMALILVGAMIVGSMSTAWAGRITPPRQRGDVMRFNYENTPIILEKGQEMGYFSLGSTVILLFASEEVHWDEALLTHPVQMGQGIAKTSPGRMHDPA